MKKTILILATLSTLFIAGCKKDPAKSGGNNTADSYQPLTAGSSWSYRNDDSQTASSPEVVDTTINTMNGKTQQYNSKTYYQATSVQGKSTATAAFAIVNHTYYMINYDSSSQSFIELPYLKDDAAVNETWQSTGTIQGIAYQFKGTMVDKNTSTTLFGKTYNNVIHTTILFQVQTNGTFLNQQSFDYYVAKGIGVVAIYTTDYTTNGLSKSELYSYTVK